MKYARILLFLLLTSVLLPSSGAFAADAAPGAAAQSPGTSGEVTAPVNAPPDNPADAEVDRTTPVAVMHSGTDAVGTQLAFALKNLFNTASLFTLTEGEAKKITVRVETRAEFPSRPQLSSVCAVTWLYSESEGTLKFFLDTDVLTVDAGQVESVARSIAARTDSISVRYGYLFE